jgi:hypothetical protein
MTSSPARDDSIPEQCAARTVDDMAVVETEEDGVYYAFHDPHTDGLTTTVALAVADVAGTSPTELIADVTTYVDPDGLNRVFRTRADGTPRTGSHVFLDIDGYRVRIESSGEIAVTPPSTEV